MAAKRSRDFQGVVNVPEAFISNCVLVQIMNFKQVTLADGAATISAQLGRFHLTHTFCQKSQVHLVGLIKN